MTSVQRIYNIACLCAAMSAGFIAYFWSRRPPQVRVPSEHDEVNVLCLRKRNGEVYLWTFNDGEAAKRRVIRAILDTAHNPELTLDFDDAWKLIKRLPRGADDIWAVGEGAGT